MAGEAADSNNNNDNTNNATPMMTADGLDSTSGAAVNNSDTSASNGAGIQIFVKCTFNQKKIKVDKVALESTVRQLKSRLREESGVEEGAQRLIYKGHVLKDGNTLESYGAYICLGEQRQTTIPFERGQNTDSSLRNEC